MPITFKIVPGKTYFMSIWKGDISDSELLDSYKRFLEGPDWEPTLNELADLSDISVSSITSSGLIQFSGFIEEFLKTKNITAMRTAVYCTDVLPEEMARIYKYWADNSPEEVHIFNNIYDAESWLSTEK